MCNDSIEPAAELQCNDPDFTARVPPAAGETGELSDLPDVPTDYFSCLGNSWREPIRDTPHAREFFQTLTEDADLQQ